MSYTLNGLHYLNAYTLCLSDLTKRIKNYFFITLVLLTVNCFAQSTQIINFESRTCISIVKINDQCDPVNIGATLYFPKNPTNTLITITHGSGGLDARHFAYAKQINSLGYAALVIDHWTPRGISKTHLNYAANLAKGGRAFNQSLDALSAMNVLANSPLGFSKFGFIGESGGGGAALWLEKNYLYTEYARLFGEKSAVMPDAIVALFPSCDERNQNELFNAIPTFILSGELDNDAPPKNCEIYASWVNKEKGGQITFQVLPGQYHDYDAPYPLTKSKNAQNPAQCVSELRGNVRTWDLNGEQFLNNAQGLRDFYSKCMQSANENPVMTGNTGDPKTGFKEWSNFFLSTLGS